MKLAQLINLFRRQQCSRLFVKILSENDNSKNQIYLGSDFSAITIFPYERIDKSAKQFKAKLDFNWLSENGVLEKASHAQLILYPQYPEVRFSGFLLGCSSAPSNIMTGREAGRLLFIGISSDNRIIGYAAPKESDLSIEFLKLSGLPAAGVFSELTSILAERDVRTELLHRLREIHNKEWIDSKKLNNMHQIQPCQAPQCGGYTLEAEFDIPPNGRSDPDFFGWELKQHAVSSFANCNAGVITLMTPEPSGGFYKDAGVIPFIKKYGYFDKCGREDRMNFGGLHYAERENPETLLMLSVKGFDSSRKIIKDINGGIALMSREGAIAALWNFSGLLEHWNKKHANAAYVPSMVRRSPTLQYRYGNIIRLGEGTDFTLFLSAIASGRIYYDPGIKLEHLSTSAPTTKRRSQFRIKSREIDALYMKLTSINILEM